MAAIMAASEGSEGHQDWDIRDISKSAFVPPKNRRAVRAWDRAKVPSRAPRLHGKKVWKKLVRAIEKDGGLEEAQQELQKEGTGSRKKLRATNAKQNIRDAEWDGTEWEGFPDEIITTVENTAQPADDESSIQDDLKFVPRKRRNNNKVVSPKKPLRQTTLNIQAQREALQISPEDAIKRANRPRKSLRKSLRRSMLVDTEANTVVSVAESPSTVLEFNLATEVSLLQVFSPVIQSPLKSPGKKQRLRGAKESRSSAGENLRLSGAFFADASSEDSRPNDGLTTENVVIQSTPVRSAKALAVPATAPPKVHLSKSELENQMVNFFTPIARMKKAKRRSSPIKSYLQELLEKKTIPLEPLEQETEEPQTSGDDNSSTGPGDIEQERERRDEPQTESITSNDDVPGVNDAQDSSSEHEADVTNSTDSATEEQETDVIESNGASEEPEPADHEHASPTQSAQPSFEHTEDVANSDSTSSESSESADSHESIESACSNTTTTGYDHDDTDMLRSFLTRVQASKAKKASPKRKRSLPHSPLRIPLGDMDNNLSPSPLKSASSKEEAVDPTSSSPVKRSKRLNLHADEPTEPQSCRRSGRTRLPVKSSAAAPSAPSFIPMRRLGQDEPTLTLSGGKNEGKELAALTRVNTRKNKAGALSAAEVLARKAEERDDPVLRQRLLKEVFEEKVKGSGKGNGKGKGVMWAEELTSVREFDEKKVVSKSVVGGGTKGGKKAKVTIVDPEEGKEEEKDKDKATRVRVGMASSRESKIALGMGVNGTPAPKRRMREPRVKA